MKNFKKIINYKIYSIKIKNRKDNKYNKTKLIDENKIIRYDK